jgi:hypothetical protein
MSRRAAAVLVALVAVAPAGPVVAAPPPAAAVTTVTGTPPTDPPFVTDNDFLPERDLSECVSAMPQPNCGSESKGGWRQALVFGVVVAALAFVGWRIIRTVRRNRREMEPSPGR